jgi:hypothetical protein
LWRAHTSTPATRSVPILVDFPQPTLERVRSAQFFLFFSSSPTHSADSRMNSLLLLLLLQEMEDDWKFSIKTFDAVEEKTFNFTRNPSAAAHETQNFRELIKIL